MKTRSIENKPQPFQSSERRQTSFLCLLLLALVWLAFAPALKNNFTTYDDPDYVTQNPHVRRGLTLEDIQWAFVSVRAANWHPLTWLSHMLDCQLFGLNPWGHHLTNLLLHAANTLLLFLVFKKMTRAVWRSFFVAALFGLHPLHVESVAWVSERKDVLSGLFWMLTLWAYARFAEESKLPAAKSKLFYGLALGFFALGLMAKPMLVTLPFVLLLLDWWPLGRFQFQVPGVKIRNLILAKLPFFLLAAASSLVTFAVQNRAGAVLSFVHLPLPERIENAVVSYVRYLGKLFWPANLSAYYPLPNHWPMTTVMVAALILLGASVFVLAMRKHRYLPVGWLWFVGTLVPVIGLVQVGGQSMADRYSYLPSIGLFVLVTWGAWDLLKRQRERAVILSIAGAAVILSCAALTRRQVGYWADGETLFRHAIGVTEDNYWAHSCLGFALNQEGRVDEAIQQYEIALELNSTDATVHNNFGFALDKQGRHDEAVGEYREALKLDPNCADAHINLGVSLSRSGQLDEAIHELQTGLALDPDSTDARYNLGNTLIKAGRLDEAISQYQQVVKLNPTDADAYNNLGVALFRARRLDEAINQYQKAVTLDPNDADAHNNFGAALYRRGLLDEAIGEYQKALSLNPDSPEVRKNLDMALQKKNAK